MITDLNENVKLHKSLLNEYEQIKKLGEAIYECHLNSGTIYTCGNGGSNADAQHLTAELMIKFKKVRKPIASVCLTLDTSTITACSNDFNFNKLFSRNLEALANENDILIIFSTSGNSQNIINALKIAKKKNVKTVGFLGKKNSESQRLCDFSFNIESKVVARIQECHIFLVHILCDYIDKKFK